MKKISVFLLSVFMSFAMIAHAQEDKSTGQKIKDGAKKTGKAIGKGAKKAGQKTAELASKGASKVVDKTYEGKTAPNGRTVYINDEAKYYWIDKKGKRHYVTEDQLIDKNSQ